MTVLLSIWTRRRFWMLLILKRTLMVFIPWIWDVLLWREGNPFLFHALPKVVLICCWGLVLKLWERMRLWSGEANLLDCLFHCYCRYLFHTMCIFYAFLVNKRFIDNVYFIFVWKRHHATVSVVHSFTKNPQELTREADIIITDVGVPNMIRGDWLKPDTFLLPTLNLRT